MYRYWCLVYVASPLHPGGAPMRYGQPAKAYKSSLINKIHIMKTEQAAICGIGKHGDSNFVAVRGADYRRQIENHCMKCTRKSALMAFKKGQK